MSGAIEKFTQRIFGAGTPKHTAIVKVEGNHTHVSLEIKQPKGTMVVRFPPGTEIRFRNETVGYRPFGEDEFILAKEINFFNEGWSNGMTTQDVYFKALADPSEITPLKDITPKKGLRRLLGS